MEESFGKGLPKVLSLSAEKVNYSPPRKRADGLQTVDVSEGIEILVTTDREIPLQSIGIALFVGGRLVDDAVKEGPNSYRFFVYDPSAVTTGATVSWGHPLSPKGRIDTGFRFSLGGGPVS